MEDGEFFSFVYKENEDLVYNGDCTVVKVHFTPIQTRVCSTIIW